MLEGLEVKVINSIDLAEDNEKFRIDDEFFLKKYINAYKLVKSKPHIQLKQILSLLTDFSANGSYASIAANFKLLDEPNYAYMVRSTDLEKSDFITDVKYVDKHSYEFLSKSKVFGGEILINKIGSPGRVYIMPKLNMPVSLGMNLFMLSIAKESNFNEKYIWTFLNTELGQNIIQRKVNGTVPLTIDKEAIRTLYIPIVSLDFQNKIENLINKSELLLANSKQLYNKGENELLNSIGLISWQPTEKNTTEKSFKNSFGVSGRLDAEYYQPKYDEVLAVIKNTKFDKLGNIVSIKKSIEPGSEAYQTEGIPFIRVSDVSKFGLSEPEIHLDSKEFNIEGLKPKKDTILLSKDGSVGIAYKIEKDLNIITSGALLHLTVKNKETLPDYLTLVLNSKLTQMQAERDAGGSIIQHWRPDQIQEVLIPILPIDKQKELSKQIQLSFKQREESIKILEIAKKTVELSIETNEEVAIKWLNETQKVI